MIKLKQFQISKLNNTCVQVAIKDNMLVHYKSKLIASLTHWINTSDHWFPRRKKFLIRLRNRFGD